MGRDCVILHTEKGGAEMAAVIVAGTILPSVLWKWIIGG